MSQAPSMPMYWDAYLADTTHLTTEEHGAYLLLLGAMWRRNGWVPDDDRDCARIVGLSPLKWRRFKERMGPVLTYVNGEITQKNLLKIWEKTQEKIEKNRANGAKGGRPESNKNNNIAKANGSVSDNPNESIPEPEPYIETLANANVCPEPEKSAPVCIRLPVTGGDDEPVLESELADWSHAFPAVDVRQHLRSMRAWLIANPTRKKTRRGVRRFIVSWLEREQNKGIAPPPHSKTPPQEDGFMQALRADLNRERARNEPDHNPTRYIDASEPGADQPGAHVVDIFAASSRRW